MGRFKDLFPLQHVNLTTEINKVEIECSKKGEKWFHDHR